VHYFSPVRNGVSEWKKIINVSGWKWMTFDNILSMQKFLLMFYCLEKLLLESFFLKFVNNMNDYYDDYQTEEVSQFCGALDEII